MLHFVGVMTTTETLNAHPKPAPGFSHCAFAPEILIKAQFLNSEFWGETSSLAPEEHMLCISPAQCYQEHKKSNTQKTYFLPHSLKLCRVNVQNVGSLENLLLFFLKVWLCGGFRMRGLSCAVQLLKLF